MMYFVVYFSQRYERDIEKHMKKYILLLLFSSILCLTSCGDETISEPTSEINSSPESIVETQEESKVDTYLLSEEEYKNLCEEKWYDDIFFSKEDLEGHLVKVELFIGDINMFKADSLYNQTVVDFVNKYNLQKTLYKCGVKRQDSNSYVGNQISLFYSNDIDYSPTKADIEKHILLYGEVIEYSTNTWNGYNTCGILAKYMEFLD